MMVADREETVLLGPRAVADACKVSIGSVYYWLRTYEDLPQPKYYVAGNMDESGERKKSPAWAPEQLPAILDWRRNRKG